MESSSVWDRLNDFRTSHAGIVIFYGYLIGILIAGIFIAKTVTDNHNLAQTNHRLVVANGKVARKAQRAADQAKAAAATGNRALCSEKASYQRQVKGAKLYLKQHPNGTADFSKDVIVAAILQAKTQLHALRDVSCGK